MGILNLEMLNSFIQRCVPGRSTWVSRPRSSWHQRCQTRRSSSELRTEWQAASLRKTRNRLRPPQDRKESVNTSHTCRSRTLRVCARARPLLVSTWCALHIRSMSCLCKNLATTSAPNVKETPRSFSPQPSTSLSGSAHSRSHSKPWSGTSVGRITLRICSMDWRSGERPGETSHTYFSLVGLMRTPSRLLKPSLPPWQQKIFSSTIAATGKQLKQSVKVFHSLMLYRRLPEQKRKMKPLHNTSDNTRIIPHLHSS